MAIGCAFVILALFISVITAAMFEALELHRMQQRAARDVLALSPYEKRKQTIQRLQVSRTRGRASRLL